MYRMKLMGLVAAGACSIPMYANSVAYTGDSGESNVEMAANQSRSRDARNSGDRNGTRGTDREGSERTVGGPSVTREGDSRTGNERSRAELVRSRRYAANRPTSFNPDARRFERGRTRTAHARSDFDRAPSNFDRAQSDFDRSAEARTPTLGSGFGQSEAIDRDRWSQRQSILDRMNEIRGSQIVAADGTPVGEIRDLVVDPASGEVAYAITGDNRRQTPIPWKALQRGTDNTYQLNVDAARLQNAPTFNPNRRPNVNDQRWSEDVQRYFIPGNETVKPNQQPVSPPQNTPTGSERQTP